MVTGMDPNRTAQRPRTEPNAVTEWLQGRGGVVFTVIAVVLVAWGIFLQVIG